MSSNETEKAQKPIDQVALAKAMRDYVPPGYRNLATVRDELGAVELRNRLFRGELQAFFLSSNGEITKCGKKLWSSDTHGEIAMRSGRLGDARILIADSPIESASLPLQLTDEVYVSPFIRLMLEASKEFNLGAGYVKKDTLEAWFLSKRLPDGTPIQVRRRYGGITSMTLHRWLKRKKMGFPKPEYINRLRYWDEVKLDAWDRARTRAEDQGYDGNDALEASASDPTADAQ